MRLKAKLKVWALAVILMLLPVMVFSQITTGTLRGYVTDTEGEALSGVSIEITSDALMSPRSGVTDSRGHFRFLYLPPGRYTICAKLEGFETCWTRGVPVQVGQISNTDIVMKVGTLETTIEVTAERPNIDIESSAKSYVVSTELLATVPLAPRVDYVDVFHTLPGVAGESLDSPLVNAGSVTHNLRNSTYFWDYHNQDDGYENKILVDGMDIMDSMSGTSYANFNYEAMEEIDVKTAGAPAEYGNARSSYMNIVTKSGGNTLKGSAFVQFQPQSFNWSNIEGGTASKTSYIIPNVMLSGPILKDKLWFLATYKFDNQDYQIPNTIVEPKLVQKTRGHMPFLKLTFQPVPKHTISAVYQSDYYEIEPSGFPSSAYSRLETANRAARGGPMFSLTWRWIITDAAYFNFTAGYNHKPRDTYAITREPRRQYTERFQGGSSLLYEGGYGEDYVSVRENALISGNLTYYVQDLANTGSHEFKVGVDVRPWQHVTRSRIYVVDELGFYQYRYGLNYANYGLSEPYVYRGYKTKGAPGLPQDRYDNEVVVTNENVFIQDRWVVTKNLSIQLGLRWEHQRENMYFRDEIPAEYDVIYSGMRDNIEFDDSGLAPRAGLTYNWENVGVFKFHFGRYFEYVGTGDYNNYARTIAFPEYRMSAANIGLGPESMTLYTDPELAYGVDYNKNMQMEYNDEFSFSFERELFADLVFETSFIYRAINTSYMENINPIFENGAFVDYKFPDFNYINQRTWYDGDDRRWKFDYKGLQFNIKRNFSGKWGIMANYSRMWRKYYKLAFDPGDPYQFVYDDPSDLDMPNYGIRWSFHFSAFYRLPWDILFSTFVNGYSGVFIQDTTGDYAWDASAPTVTISNGRRVSDIVWQAFNNYYVGGFWGASGRYTDDIWSVNFRLAKGLAIGRFRIEVAMDLYNAFNWGKYSMYYTTDIRRDYVDSSGINQYQRMITPQSPRVAQLTVKIEF